MYYPFSWKVVGIFPGLCIGDRRRRPLVDQFRSKWPLNCSTIELPYDGHSHYRPLSITAYYPRLKTFTGWVNISVLFITDRLDRYMEVCVSLIP